mmetsp:Transcript_18008/g.54211  ORF Transcript_18008/g.54211 Transcript_18008/m.54211 type:complete len:164 (-) Transcript_18008:265-756(-)
MDAAIREQPILGWIQAPTPAAYSVVPAHAPQSPHSAYLPLKQQSIAAIRAAHILYIWRARGTWGPLCRSQISSQFQNRRSSHTPLCSLADHCCRCHCCGHFSSSSSSNSTTTTIMHSQSSIKGIDPCAGPTVRSCKSAISLFTDMLSARAPRHSFAAAGTASC